MRHRLPQEVELAVEVGRHRAVPVAGVERLDPAGRTGDAGIVHQHVQAAKLAAHLFKQGSDLIIFGDIGPAGAHAGLAPARLEPVGIDVADMDACAVLDKRVHDRASDAGRTGGDEDPESALKISFQHGLSLSSGRGPPGATTKPRRAQNKRALLRRASAG